MGRGGHRRDLMSDLAVGHLSVPSVPMAPSSAPSLSVSLCYSPDHPVGRVKFLGCTQNDLEYEHDHHVPSSASEWRVPWSLRLELNPQTPALCQPHASPVVRLHHHPPTPPPPGLPRTCHFPHIPRVRPSVHSADCVPGSASAGGAHR